MLITALTFCFYFNSPNIVLVGQQSLNQALTNIADISTDTSTDIILVNILVPILILTLVPTVILILMHLYAHG